MYKAIDREVSIQGQLGLPNRLSLTRYAQPTMSVWSTRLVRPN